MFICITNGAEMWSKADLRRSMLLEKVFLSNIHHSSPLTVSTILAAATNLQINVLIRVLHFVASGQIPVDSKLIEKLSSSRKTGYLHKNFKGKNIVKNLLGSNREAKLAVLNKISKFMPSLLER